MLAVRWDTFAVGMAVARQNSFAAEMVLEHAGWWLGSEKAEKGAVAGVEDIGADAEAVADVDVDAELEQEQRGRGFGESWSAHVEAAARGLGLFVAHGLVAAGAHCSAAVRCQAGLHLLMVMQKSFRCHLL